MKKTLAHTKESFASQEIENAKYIDGTFITKEGVPMPLSMDTRAGRGLRSSDNRKILVDVREFRSTLPSHLYNKGFILGPETLYCGDFVLSEKVVVEKKSRPDLIGR